MPEDFYKVGPPKNRQLDELGLRALQRDWAAWPGEPSEDFIHRSQFNLLYDIGVYLFGRNCGQAREYAMYFMSRCQRLAPVARPPDAQRYLRLGRSIEATTAPVPS